jgi:hypothetical protein
VSTMPTPRVIPLLVVLAATALAPGSASASAGAWPARTVATGGPAFADDVDGLPNGSVATLLERRSGRSSRLELWIGSRRTRIATSPTGHSFGARMGHDRRGRIVVAWATIPGRTGARQAYAWTAARGVQRLTSGTRSVVDADVAVAPDGRAAIVAPQTGKSGGGTIARGSTTGGFTTTQPIGSGDVGFPSFVGIADDATVTVGWTDGRDVGLTRAAWGAPFGAAVHVPVDHLDDMTMTVTGAGRAVVAVKQTALRLDGSSTRDVSAFTWDPGTAAPGPPVRLSQGQAGTPAALAVGDRAFVVWRQARTTRSSPATLGAAVFAPGATAPSTRLTVPGRGGAGGPLGSIALAPSGTGVRPYFRVGGSIHSTHVSASGRVSGTSVALGPAERAPFVSAAEADGRPVVVWTRQMFDGNAGYRIRIARP